MIAPGRSLRTLYLTKRARGVYKRLKDRIEEKEAYAKTIIVEMTSFSFDQFKIQFLRKPTDGVNVFYYFKQKELEFNKAEKFSSESSYRNAKDSLTQFQESKKQSTSFLNFETVTADYLKEYEKFMLSSTDDRKARSLSTVGVYCRNLRSLFNEADAARQIDKRKVYPFGRYKGQYQIPTASKVKKALSKEKLGAFLYAEVEAGSVTEKARDFWFFSYVANGMNTKDIASLQYKNLTDTAIIFHREKIKDTGRANAKPIIVTLNEYLRGIISKYGNDKVSAETYVFPILNHEMSAKRKFESARNFTRYINQSCKRLAATIGLEEEISMNWARHSFTTQSIQNGQELEFIQDALGHKSKQTTQNYWAGFEEAHKSENQKALLELPKPEQSNKENGNLRIAT